MAKKKIDFGNIVAAAGAGAVYNFAIEAASKEVEFIQENYLVAKGVGGLLLGTGLLYFGGNDKKTEAAGYGILGAGGAAIASKIRTMGDDDSDDDTMNGLRDRLKKGIPKRPGAAKILSIAKKGAKLGIPGMMSREIIHKMVSKNLPGRGQGKQRNPDDMAKKFLQETNEVLPFDFSNIINSSVYGV